jgi:hypothetical protein
MWSNLVEMKAPLALSLIASTAFAAGADVSPQRPESCVLVATVQDDHCAAKSYYRCSGPGSVVFRIDVHYAGGEVEIHTADANHGGIEIISPPGGAHYSIRAQGDHPRIVVETGSGRETEIASITRNGKSQTATMVADYSYLGKSRKLAGETFYRLNYATTITFPASGSVLHTSGTVLYNDQLDLLIDEVEVSDGQGGPARKIKLSSLSLEGQKGFGSTKPKYGCN